MRLIYTNELDNSSVLDDDTGAGGCSSFATATPAYRLYDRDIGKLCIAASSSTPLKIRIDRISTQSTVSCILIPPGHNLAGNTTASTATMQIIGGDTTAMSSTFLPAIRPSTGLIYYSIPVQYADNLADSVIDTTVLNCTFTAGATSTVAETATGLKWHTTAAASAAFAHLQWTFAPSVDWFIEFRARLFSPQQQSFFNLYQEQGINAGAPGVATTYITESNGIISVRQNAGAMAGFQIRLFGTNDTYYLTTSEQLTTVATTALKARSTANEFLFRMDNNGAGSKFKIHIEETGTTRAFDSKWVRWDSLRNLLPLNSSNRNCVVIGDYFNDLEYSSVANYMYHILYGPSTYTTVKYLGVVCSSNMLHQLPELVFSNPTTFPRQPYIATGALESEFNVENVQTLSGLDRFIVRGDAKRRRSYSFPSCTKMQMEVYNSINNTYGMSKPFWMQDHDGVWIYGKLNTPMTISKNAEGFYDITFDFIEVLA